MLGAYTLLTHIFLGALLIITGLLKFPNVKGFVVIVASFRIFPGKLNKIIGISTPFIEVGLGLLLLLGFYADIITVLALLYFLSLLGLTTYIMLIGRKISNCGCYGADIVEPITWGKVIENTAFSSLALSLVFAYYMQMYQEYALWGFVALFVIFIMYKYNQKQSKKK